MLYFETIYGPVDSSPTPICQWQRAEVVTVPNARNMILLQKPVMGPMPGFKVLRSNIQRSANNTYHERTVTLAGVSNRLQQYWNK